MRGVGGTLTVYTVDARYLVFVGLRRRCLLLFVTAGCAGTARQARECPEPIAIEDVAKSGQAAEGEIDGTSPADDATQPRYRLPFPEGYRTEIIQGFHGALSHHDDLAYAIDMACEIGDPVAASRVGTVWSVKEDSDESCADRSCRHAANYIVIDHGDGTYGAYFHLAHEGADVSVGQAVCAGEVIGRCGQSGFATRPHLHFSVNDVTGASRRFELEEARDQREFGTPIPDSHLVSANSAAEPCSNVAPSVISVDGFAHHGVRLAQPIPTVLDDREPRVLRGRYFGEHPRIALHRRTTVGGEWQRQCVPVDEGGTFEVVLDWPTGKFEAGHYWLMLTGATATCQKPGWDWSYEVRLDR